MGQGVYALCEPMLNQCGEVHLRESAIVGSTGAGVAISGPPGAMEDSLIDTVYSRDTDDAFGYGLQVEGLLGAPTTIFHVSSSRIRGATLAGAMYTRSEGTVSNVEITGGAYTVVTSPGSMVNIVGNNALSGTTSDQQTWSSMEPTPAPAPVEPIIEGS
jgi:hypothetical protein